MNMFNFNRLRQFKKVCPLVILIKEYMSTYLAILGSFIKGGYVLRWLYAYTGTYLYVLLVVLCCL